jgi:hypothetical protein
VLGKSGPGCHMAVLGAAVDNHAGKIHDLESARMRATGSAAVATEQAEKAFEMGGKDTSRRPPTRPSAVRPRSVSWPPSSCALQVAARGSAKIQVERAQAVVARVAGARAGSAMVLPGLAETEHRAAIALQHWQPDRVDEGDGGGVGW